jgi:hypothetical protein
VFFITLGYASNGNKPVNVLIIILVFTPGLETSLDVQKQVPNKEGLNLFLYQAKLLWIKDHITQKATTTKK